MHARHTENSLRLSERYLQHTFRETSSHHCGSGLWLQPCAGVCVWKNGLELREKSSLCFFFPSPFLLGGWPGTAVLFPVSLAAEATHTGHDSAPGWPHCGSAPRLQATARRQRPTKWELNEVFILVALCFLSWRGRNYSLVFITLNHLIKWQHQHFFTTREST